MVLFCKPRVCGEKGVYAMLYTGLWGSPPHVRGKGASWYTPTMTAGITLAYAGKSDRADIILSPNRDHPRVCGEKFCFVLSLYNLLGSPPRMRGKGRRHLGPQLLHGITPVCGEKQALLCTWMFLQGSPPRMRGKESHARRKRQAHGITPACAGKSSRPDRPSTGLLDHPRMCGEKTL